MPQDKQGTWFSADLIAGRRQMLAVYNPEVSSPEEQAKSSQRLALLDLDTAKLSEFRTLDPGDQIGSRANDGRYLAFVEIGVMGAKAPDWRLFVRDLDSGDTWEVDRASALDAPDDAPGIGLLGPWLDVSEGMLAYARYRRGASAGWLYEIVLVDLSTRSAATVAEHSTSDGNVNALEIGSGSLYWLVRFHPAVADARSSLHEFAIQTQSENQIAVAPALLQIAVRGSALAASSASGVFVRASDGAFNQIATTNGLPMSLDVAGDNIFWVDTGTQRPLVASLPDGTPVELDITPTVSLFTDGNLAVWETTVHSLKWIALPK